MRLGRIDRNRVFDRVAELGLAVAASTAACLWVAAVDWFGLSDVGSRPSVQVAQVLAGFALTVGVALGAGLFFLFGIARAFSGKEPRLWPSVLVTVLPVSPFVWYMVEGVVQGPRVREILPFGVIVPLGTLVLCVCAACGVALAVWLGRRRADGVMDRVSVWMGLAALCGISACVQWVNGHVYLRLYPEIHTGLTWCGWALAAWGFAILLMAGLRGRRAWFFWAGAMAPAVAVAALVFMLGPLRKSHRVRFLVVDRCPSGRQVVELWRSVRSGPSLGALSAGHEPVNGDPARQPSGMLRMRGRSVVLISVDALRADRMGCYGGRRPLTPNADRWARRAVRFKRAYCHAPHSSFSLSALLTGRPLRSYAALNRPLPATLASMLRDVGYLTRGFCTRGVFYTGERALQGYIRDNFGFERFDPHGYDASELTDLALRELEVFDRARTPFFLWVHYFDAHEPYRRHADLDFGSRPSDRYDSEVAYVDRQVGRLIDAALRLDPEPIIVFTADHGEEFGEHGGHYHGSSVYDEQVRIPLMVSAPGVRGRVVRRPVSHLSVVPTLLDLLDVDPPVPFAAPSLAEAMLGLPQHLPAVHAEVHTTRMVIQGPYKLIWDTWRQTFELYQLHKDPQERRDLSDAQPERVDALKSLIAEYIRRLGRRSAAVPAALAAARLGGRQAAGGLCALLADTRAIRKHRVEAARRLGRMVGTCAADALGRALADEDEAIAAEAAIALGELRRPEGADALRGVLESASEPERLHRAAVAAGRLGLKESEPYLIGALSAPNHRIRYRAAHYLGQVGTAHCVAALIRAFQDAASAHLVAESLGQVGSRSGGKAGDRAVAFLLEQLGRERRNHVVQSILKGLGYLARPEALPALAALLGRPDLPEAREALVRACGVGRGVWGVDFAPANRDAFEGVQWCRQTTDRLDFEFLGYTVCRLGPRASVRLEVANPDENKTLMFRVRPAGPGSRDIRSQPSLGLTLNGKSLGTFRLTWGWQELSARTGPDTWASGNNVLELEVLGAAGLVADYLLVFRQ